MVKEGLPKEMTAKVVYIHKPGKTDWDSPKSYRAISLLSTLGKMAEAAVAGHISLTGEVKGWWHQGQCGTEWTTSRWGDRGDYCGLCCVYYCAGYGYSLLPCITSTEINYATYT